MWKSVEIALSADRNVSKYIFESSDNPAVVEAVLYKYPTYKDRTVICCSTQSGCPVGCRFCGAGDAFVRSLTAEEIVSQVDILLGSIDCNPLDIGSLQIMFMSMGEPMLNQRNLIKAIRILNNKYPNGSLLVSTIGPQVEYMEFFKVSREIDKVGLQFSIHETTDESRSELIPFDRKMSLQSISNMGNDWFNETGRKPYFNYCAHSENSSLEDVDRLVALFNPDVFCATVSVICERDETLKVAYDRQAEMTVDFTTALRLKGYDTRVFNPAGQDDIGGGCGQLWFVQQWMRENPEYIRASRGNGLPIRHAIQKDINIL